MVTRAISLFATTHDTLDEDLLKRFESDDVSEQAQGATEMLQLGFISSAGIKTTGPLMALSKSLKGKNPSKNAASGLLFAKVLCQSLSLPSTATPT